MKMAQLYRESKPLNRKSGSFRKAAFPPRRRGKVPAHHESGFSSLSRATSHEPLLVRFSRDTDHATWFFPVPPATPRRATPSPANGFFTNHESRITKHGFFQTRNTAFSVAPMVLVGTEALQSCFFGRNVLQVDSDDAVAGTENLIRARRERAGWRRQSRPSHFLSGVYETRDPRHGVSLARGASRREFRGFHESRDPRHETRLFSGPKHGFSVAPMVLVGTEALQSFFWSEAGLG